MLAERIRSWHLSNTKDKAPPARRIEDLAPFRTTQARRQLAGTVRRLISTIRRGDIIIVPPRGDDEDVLFGEVMGDSFVNVQIPYYPDENMVAREVDWRFFARRGAVPSWLERKIPNQNPIRQVERSHYELIFDLMYEGYYYNGRYACKFKVTTNDFSSLDNFRFLQLVLYVAKLFEKSVEDGAINIAGSESIASVAASIESPEDVPDQRISISSPGFIVVYSKNIIPLVAGVLIALAATTGQALAPDQAEFLILNSADGSALSAQCQADVHAEVMSDLVAMGYQHWQELCRIEQLARQRTQLNSGIGVMSKSEDAVGPGAAER